MGWMDVYSLCKHIVRMSCTYVYVVKSQALNPAPQLQQVSLTHLYQMAGTCGMVRAGSTIDPDRRRREYVYRRNYCGIMYYAPTSNMNESENVLLQYIYRDNEQYTSNQEAEPGYVYLIKEW